jgi:hypothetical protein
VSFSQFLVLCFTSSLQVAIPWPAVYWEFQLFHYCNVTQALNPVGIPAVYTVGISAVSIKQLPTLFLCTNACSHAQSLLRRVTPPLALQHQQPSKAVRDGRSHWTTDHCASPSKVAGHHIDGWRRQPPLRPTGLHNPHPAAAEEGVTVV